MSGGLALIKSKNCKFYTMIGECRTVRLASQNAGIGRQHGTKILKQWVDKGLIVKGTIHNNKYTYTHKGQLLRARVADMLILVGADDE